MSGTLHLVGVGPGDPELLTLKAARILREAEVIAYPVANEATTLALDIARAHLGAAAIMLPVSIDMSAARGAGRKAAYAEAAARIVAHLEIGRSVAYLCEGDPLFYGSAMYLLPHLAGYDVVVVPGVSSMTAAAAAVPLPLVSQSEHLIVLPGPLDDAGFRASLGQGGSFVILKIGRHFDRVRARLAEAGRLDRSWFVEHATTPRQQVARLADLPAGDKPYFSLILSRPTAAPGRQ